MARLLNFMTYLRNYDHYQGSNHVGRRRPAVAKTDTCPPALRANLHTTGGHRNVKIQRKSHGECLKIHGNICNCTLTQLTILSGHHDAKQGI